MTGYNVDSFEHYVRNTEVDFYSKNKEKGTVPADVVGASLLFMYSSGNC